MAVTPTSFDTQLLGFGPSEPGRGLLAVGRGNGDVELMLWGNHQGWISWRVRLLALYKLLAGCLCECVG